MIERYRSELNSNSATIEEVKSGAGSRSRQTSVGQMAAISSVNNKYGRLLFNLVVCHKPDLIIELGTAFGISTMYMAAANPEAPVITVEGNSQLAAIAAEGFRKNNFFLLYQAFIILQYQPKAESKRKSEGGQCHLLKFVVQVDRYGVLHNISDIEQKKGQGDHKKQLHR